MCTTAAAVPASRQGLREPRGEDALARAARPVDGHQSGTPQPRRPGQHPPGQRRVRLDQRHRHGCDASGCPPSAWFRHRQPAFAARSHPGERHDLDVLNDVMSPGVDALLEQARSGLRRLTPQATVEAVRAGALLVDIRPEAQRREQGNLPGAIVIDRTVLEWRLDPASESRIPEATGYDREIVLICRHGYSSSLAAASLQALGLRNATDVIGGVEAWQEAGLPFSDDPADIRP